MDKNQIVTVAHLDQWGERIINSLSKTEVKPPIKILRSADVKKMLGISTGSVQNLRISGKLKFSKVNGTIFYDYDDVLNLLKESTVGKKSIFSAK